MEKMPILELSISFTDRCKEVLVKYVAQVISPYCMDAFFPPSTLCDEIERIMNSFD